MIDRLFNLGVTQNLKIEEAQVVRLTNIMAVTPLTIYLFYLWYGFYYDQPYSIILAVTMTILTGISLILNCQQKYDIAKALLFILNSISIWTTYHIFNGDYSVLSFFFPILFCFPLFFNIKEEKAAFILSFSFTLLCIISSFIVPKQLIHAINLTPKINALTDLFHITLSFSITILISYIIFKNRDSTYEKLIHEREKAEDAFLKLKQTQAHLIQNEKMASLGTLLAGVSHEINNPLNFIKGSVTVFEEKFKKDFEDSSATYSKYFEILNEGVSRISNITKSLNHFNYQTPSFTNDCDLSLILNNCLIILKFELKGHIKVETEISDTPLIKGNSGQLHQVFLNIITNSIHSIEDKGKISIETLKSKDSVSVLITDNGKGIDSTNLQKIFDPFYTTKAPGKGTGLGLSIAYNIIKDHLGDIEIKSSLNNGTQVIVKFPVKE